MRPNVPALHPSIDPSFLPPPPTDPGSASGMLGRYGAAREISIHQDGSELGKKLDKRGGFDGGGAVSETGGWRSRSDTERYE